MKKTTIIISLVIYSILISVLFVGFFSAQKEVNPLSQCYTNLSPSKYFQDSPSPYQISDNGIKIFIEDDFYIAKGSGSGSMRPFSNGAYYISVKIKSLDDVQIGDIIHFERQTDKENISHRIINITNEGLITKGDNNVAQDKYLVQFSDIKGKAVGVLW